MKKKDFKINKIEFKRSSLCNLNATLMKKHKIHNHFIGNFHLTHKKHLYKNITSFYKK